MAPLLPILLLLAPAPEREVELDWRAPAACPDASAILSDVIELTGRSLAEGPLRLVVTATVSGPPWRAEFVAQSAAGRSDRALVGETCDALARAAGVIIAIALADVRRLPSSSPWPSPPRRPQPAVLTTPPLVARWPTTVDVWTAVGPHFGVLAHPGAGAAVGIDVSRVQLRGRIGAFFRSAPDQSAEGRAIGYQSAGGRGEGCWLWPRRHWELEACAGFEAGAWWVTDRLTDRTTTSPWVAAHAGAGAGFRLSGPLWIMGRLGLGVPLSRGEVQVSRVPNRPDLNVTVFEPEPVHPRLEVGVTGRFR